MFEPVDEMLEDALVQLVEDVGCERLVNVAIGVVLPEHVDWLRACFLASIHPLLQIVWMLVAIRQSLKRSIDIPQLASLQRAKTGLVELSLGTGYALHTCDKYLLGGIAEIGG